MQLFIDTTGDETIIQLRVDDDILVEKKWPAGHNQSEELLQEIDKLLNDNNLDKESLEGVIVNPGPGKYTGQRVGVTTANFLGFALNLPVTINNSDDMGFSKAVLPVYAHAPVITKSAKKK